MHSVIPCTQAFNMASKMSDIQMFLVFSFWLLQSGLKVSLILLQYFICFCENNFFKNWVLAFHAPLKDWKYILKHLPLKDWVSSAGGGFKELLCNSFIKLEAEDSKQGEVPK